MHCPTITCVTSSFEFSTYPARLSDEERDKALRVLRDGVAMGRLSHDTFVRRMELALAARRSDELAALVADLPRENRVLPRGPWAPWRPSPGSPCELRRAWQAERLPKLLLPHPGLGHPLRIGRDPANGLRLNHETVSRVHAELRHQGGLWVLKDLGSTSGTTVNGRRVVGAVAVREGDQVAFGRMAFRLTAP